MPVRGEIADWGAPCCGPGPDGDVRDAVAIALAARPAGQLGAVGRVGQQLALGVSGQPQHAYRLAVVQEVQVRSFEVGPPRPVLPGCPAGTGRLLNGSRLVCRRQMAARSSHSQDVARCCPVSRISASSNGRPGSGSNRTSVCRPAAAAAMRTLKSAAPQAMHVARPCGSPTGNILAGSACSSIAPSASRIWNRHGWVLCIDGAATAAASSSSVSCRDGTHRSVRPPATGRITRSFPHSGPLPET